MEACTNTSVVRVLNIYEVALWRGSFLLAFKHLTTASDEIQKENIWSVCERGKLGLANHSKLLFCFFLTIYCPSIDADHRRKNCNIDSRAIDCLHISPILMSLIFFSFSIGPIFFKTPICSLKGKKRYFFHFHDYSDFFQKTGLYLVIRDGNSFFPSCAWLHL